MSDNLERLVLIIEARLASVEGAFGQSDSRSPKFYEWLNSREQAYCGIIDDLVSVECAKFHSGETATLRLAKVNTSATGGPHALLRNWINAARRRISAEKAVAA